jgi:hypothetical protein
VTPKQAGRYPLGGYLFAGVPGVLAISGVLLRLASGAPHPSEAKTTAPPPPAVEASPGPAAVPSPAPDVPRPPSSRESAEEIIEVFSQGRVSDARAMARGAGHAELLATLDRFEENYSLGLEARAAGQRQVALRHLLECLAIDRDLTKGRSNLSQRLQRQIASLRSKNSK